MLKEIGKWFYREVKWLRMLKRYIKNILCFLRKTKMSSVVWYWVCIKEKMIENIIVGFVLVKMNLGKIGEKVFFFRFSILFFVVGVLVVFGNIYV